ncbi:hypothetical protein GCM10007862_17680 [Dyella lipolytica]|uniref:Uncharacterized protein n=1 Tax=Dyella lipolytica TaxID=1867835 RepID=A0ABW8IU26_9GAMM|nr:hypothetical protein [Dyella lipolytica]GLQ46717.1 hypothetical protein GCM10007862_17680 [Dyella lipolytica]
MKRLIIASTVALGLACVGSTSVAQNQTQATNLQNFTVNAPAVQYETYFVNLPMGYGLEALVGNTHRQYVQAERAAEGSEALRKQGMASRPFVAVAIDNSDGPGVAKRFVLSDSAQNTVAVVDVYCKRAAPEGKRCRLVSRLGQANALAIAVPLTGKARRGQSALQI